MRRKILVLALLFARNILITVLALYFYPWWTTIAERFTRPMQYHEYGKCYFWIIQSIPIDIVAVLWIVFVISIFIMEPKFRR